MNDDSWFAANREFDDRELPDPPENDDDETATAWCPQCGAEVYEDAVRCPVCEAYITPTSGKSPWSNRPAWWIILGLLGIAATVVALAVW